MAAVYYTYLSPRIGAGRIKRIWQKDKIPPRSDNLTVAILNFAKYMGIERLPKATQIRLAADPYFKYCFGDLVSHYHVSYKFEGAAVSIPVVTPERMFELLNNPELANEEDMYLGMSGYMNNFPAHLPGGSAYGYYISHQKMLSLPQFARLKRQLQCAKLIFERNIDGDLFQTMRQERKTRFREMSYKEKLPFSKLCIGIFEEMMRAYGFSRVELKA